MPRTGVEIPKGGLHAGSWSFGVQRTNQSTNQPAIQLSYLPSFGSNSPTHWPAPGGPAALKPARAPARPAAADSGAARVRDSGSPAAPAASTTSLRETAAAASRHAP